MTFQSSGKNTSKNSGARNLFFVFIGLCALLYLAGLIWFSSLLPQTAEAPERKSDALVVLTGGSERLNQGLKLLSEGAAQKLFVSGVYHGVEVDELLQLAQQRPEDLSCCITLGYEAEDTRSNAEETAAWVKEQQIGSIRLITANYHMPRSLLEFRATLPDTLILAHPVFPESFKQEEWWLWPGSTSLLVSEYSKYLAAQLRLRLLGH